MRAMTQRTTSRDRKGAAPRVVPMVTLLCLDSWRFEHVSVFQMVGCQSLGVCWQKLQMGWRSARTNRATFLLTPKEQNTREKIDRLVSIGEQSPFEIGVGHF